MSWGKEYDRQRKTWIESTGEEKEIKNVEQNENSPVETIDEKLKMLHTNEIDGRKRLKLREEKGVGGREKQRQLGWGTDK